MTVDNVALVKAFGAVDRVTNFEREPELGELQQVVNGKLEVVKEQTAKSYVAKTTEVKGSDDAQTLRQKRAVARLAAYTTFASGRELGSDVDKIDLKAEYEKAKTELGPKVKELLDTYTSARVPALKALVQAANNVNQTVANAAVDAAVDKAKPFLATIVKFARANDLKAKDQRVYIEAAKAIFESSEKELLTSEVRSSLGIAEGTDEASIKAANEQAKEILVLKIAAKIKPQPEA